MFVFLLPEKMRTPKDFYACMLLWLCLYAYGVKLTIRVGNTDCYFYFFACTATVNGILKSF